MFDCFQIRDLTFMTVKLKPLEDRQGFRVFTDDIVDNHISGDHIRTPLEKIWNSVKVFKVALKFT